MFPYIVRQSLTNAILSHKQNKTQIFKYLLKSAYPYENRFHWMKILTSAKDKKIRFLGVYHFNSLAN